MKIKVQFHGEFIVVGSELTLTVPRGTSVQKLLETLADQHKEAFERKLFDTKGKPLPQPLLKVLVNGISAEFKQKLQNRDTVSIFPLASIGGG